MMAIRVPEMAIEEPEAKILAEAIVRVEAYYPRVREIVTGKIAAHGALILAIGQVYGTRLVAIKARVATEKRENSNVVDMTGQFRKQ